MVLIKRTRDKEKRRDAGGVLAASTSRIRIDELPSGFKPYPDGVSLWYRTYTFDEVDEFNETAQHWSEDLVGGLEFLAKGVEAQGMEKEDLTVQDILYIGLLRKLSTFGTQEFSVHVDHPEDGSRHVVVFSLGDVEFDDLDVPDLPVVVDTREGPLHFSPLTLRGYAQTADKEKPNSRQVLAAQCVNLEYGEARKIIGDSTGEDMLALMEADRLLKHGVKPLDAVYSLEDGKEVRRSVVLSNPRTLVYPFRGKEVPLANAIRFGVHGNDRR